MNLWVCLLYTDRYYMLLAAADIVFFPTFIVILFLDARPRGMVSRESAWGSVLPLESECLQRTLHIGWVLLNLVIKNNI